MKVLATVTWYIAPFIYSVIMAVTLYAQSQSSLQEENRRIIESEVQRLNAAREIHDRDVRQLQQEIHMQNQQINARMDVIEKYLFYLFVGSGGTIGVVGIDKAGYWIKKSRTSK